MNLIVLDLSSNFIEGDLSKLPPNIRFLSINKLHGTIPSTFAKGCALKNLNLNSNHLEGPLTPSITNCKGLQVLDVGNNMVNDSFPYWIKALSELQVLVLRSSKFHGPITAPTSSRSLPK
ncbi:hypothetical protein Godav_019207 [Gossypium davidsonii]|uniref:Uncharacterized protein n=1 Tax=Gossypium davidsonii TaxID=34287 RepID=A0A7J8R0B5_GOSDV|nr:hypothetical protein [Gossypium davidsonii]